MIKVYIGNNKINSVFNGNVRRVAFNNYLINEATTISNNFFTATGITDVTIQSSIINLVYELLESNLWDKMIAIYPFVGGTANTHKYNLKDPRDLDVAYRLTYSGTVIHNSDGIFPNGIDGMANTYIVPNNTMNDMSSHLAFYSRTNSAKEIADICALDTNSRLIMQIRWTDGTFFSDMYGFTGGGRLTYNHSDSSGFWVMSRTANNSHKIYKTGANVATTTDTADVGSISQINVPLLLFTFGSGGFSDRASSFISIGGGLSDSDVSKLNLIIQTFQTTLGRNV